jgi:hypothetical protein
MTTDLFRAASAAVFCILAAASAGAQEPSASREEARASLERTCQEGGGETAACACSAGVLDDNLTARELAAVALIFADPFAAVDPGASIATLLTAGYDLGEITALVERIVELEGAAETRCAVPAAPPELDTGPD